MLVPAALLLLAACEEPDPGLVAGGPCTYSSEELATTVTGSDAEYVTLVAEGGQEFPLPASEFSEIPKIGDTVRVKKDTITTGTCTPVIFHVL